ncbi:MAG: hydantoinase/oxoprolinase family protein, partial [Betaproteobacteria bacterium]|nr:hydantoinase/oxoprolinase family protein [Betaproteobacteria bacterium]
RETAFTLDMAYLGQTHTVSVDVPVEVENGTVTPPSEAQIGAAFDAAYMATYGRLLENGVRWVMNLRSAVTGKRPRFDLSTLAPRGGSLDGALKGTRPVHFGDTWHETKLYDRLALPIGAEIPGPAILEQPDTTVLIEPDLIGRIDAFGNTIIERNTP